MMHFVNGKPQEVVAVTDRGLLYGHSLFETIAVQARQALLLEQHLQRLEIGCAVLAIPLDCELLRQEINSACAGLALEPLVLRITITMGSGGRGYLNPQAAKPTRILSFSTYPQLPASHWQNGIELGIADIRLAAQPALAGIKHGNRLEQVIGRTQWLADWQEALLLDQQDKVIEGTQSNLFILQGRVLKTPDLSQCGVAGVMRNYLLEQAHRVGVTTAIVSLSVAAVEAADEVFLSNSLIGLWPVSRFCKSRYNNLTISHKLLNILKTDGAIPTF